MAIMFLLLEHIYVNVYQPELLKYTIHCVVISIQQTTPTKQNRPWHFGSDGSSPIDRAQRAGYSGRLLGENISETYESELETVAAWMQQADTRDVITDPDARDLGFAFYQEETGKIWWTMVTGDGGTTGQGLPANSNS